MGKRLSTAKSIFLARLIADVRAGHAAFNAVHAISAATVSTNLGTVFLELDTALSEYCRPPHEQAAACCGMLPPDLLAEALAAELGRQGAADRSVLLVLDAVNELPPHAVVAAGRAAPALPRPPEHHPVRRPLRRDGTRETSGGIHFHTPRTQQARPPRTHRAPATHTAGPQATHISGPPATLTHRARTPHTQRAFCCCHPFLHALSIKVGAKIP